jgi:hypothetical protein
LRNARFGPVRSVPPALLASYHTILAVLARNVATADRRALPKWLAAALIRHTRAGLEAVENLPSAESDAYAAMIANREAGEQRIAGLFQRAAESGQVEYWPFGEPETDD